VEYWGVCHPALSMLENEWGMTGVGNIKTIGEHMKRPQGGSAGFALAGSQAAAWPATLASRATTTSAAIRSGWNLMTGAMEWCAENSIIAGYFSLGPMQEAKDDDAEPMYGWGQRSDRVYARHRPGTKNVADGSEVMLNSSEVTQALKR
jgi:hypothetical protein